VDQRGRGHSLNGQGAAGREQVVRDAAPYEVQVPIPDDGHVTVDIRERRADVVARLLAMEVSPRTLITLLPEWERLILTVAAQHTARR